MKHIYYYETIFGEIGIADNGKAGADAAVTRMYLWDQPDMIQYEECESEIIKEAAIQLTEYLAGERKDFELKFEFHGTEFEKRVWNALFQIPYGETRTYKEIAELVGSPKACRAVGRANGCNPIAIFAPCHRVIGTNGKLTGYAGGLDMKIKLLELEGVMVE